jgi:beta-N-acetylhexosaminidase
VTALERLAGGVLCVGFRGDTPATAPLDELRALAPGGIVLFSRNLSASPERNRELVNAIREALGGALFAIDQEGGRVVRLRRGALALPSAMAVAASGEPSAANLLALGVAGDLRAIGVDLNFAPVADLALAACGTVIGTRAYSDDPQRAAALVAATVRGLRRGDIGATLKHFPGHGATAVDSHAALPVLEVDGATLRAREFVPFEAGIAAGARAVMVGHLLVPALDREWPASLSRRAIGDVLRRELGFEGVVVTDCLQMDAIAKGVGTVRSAVLALAAGADMLAISHDLSIARAARDAIVAAVQSGELSRAALEAAAARVAGLRRDSWAPFEEFDAREVAQHIARCAITLVRGSAALPRDRPVNVISFEGGAGDGVAPDSAASVPLHLALRRRRVPAELLRVALAPDEEMLENLCALVASQRDRSVVIVMRRAHVHEAQARAIDALLGLVPEAIVVSALEPFDLSRFPQARTMLCTYGDDETAIDALADILAGVATPAGSLPVALERVAS